jgi:hypothetical protein
MWIIEVNFAGHQFTYRVHGGRRSFFRFGPRRFGWRPSQVRGPRAA